ncbi:hypothetical protein [Dactylosporangium darangshiense]|uniref:hypothetical protein n=1 Tax=Dactylosporangium darangshiense TaxID=579108 RepID=UPI0031F08DC6
MISIKTELVIAGALLVAGLGGWAAQAAFAPGPLTAAQVAAAAGCATVDRLHPDPGVRESAACQLDHKRLTIVTFDDGRQRDGWIGKMHTEVAVSLGTEKVVAGDGWAVLTDNLAAANRLAVKANGWWA